MIESLILQCHILFHSHCSVCKPLRQISVCHCRPLYRSVPVGPSPPPPATGHRPISVSFPLAWRISLSNSLTTSQLRLELSLSCVPESAYHTQSSERKKEKKEKYFFFSHLHIWRTQVYYSENSILSIVVWEFITNVIHYYDHEQEYTCNEVSKRMASHTLPPLPN